MRSGSGFFIEEPDLVPISTLLERWLAMRPRSLAVRDILRVFLVFSVFFVTDTPLPAGMSSADDLDAKSQLEILSKEIPKILSKSAFDTRRLISNHDAIDEEAHIRSEIAFARRLTSHTAKITITVYYRFPGTKKPLLPDFTITAFLKYMDGCWTVSEYDSTYPKEDENAKRNLAGLIFQIDQLAGGIKKN